MITHLHHLFPIFLAFALTALQAADKWQNFTTDQGLPGNEIQFIKADDSQRLWVGTRSGLGSFADGKFSTQIKEGEYWDILRVTTGKYWVGSGHGVLLLEGDKQEVFLKGTTVAPLVTFDGFLLAIAKNRGTERNSLVKCQAGAWDYVQEFKDEKVVDLKRTPDGMVWVIVDGNGVIALSPGKPLSTSNRALEGSNVTAIFEDSQKRTWFGLWEGGVVVKEGDEFKRHLKKEKSFVFEIVQDKEGQIWLATNQNGLWRLKGEEWINDLKEEGGVNLLAATSDGKVWISTQTKGGLRYWNGKEWVVSLDSPLPIRCLYEGKDGKLWAGGVLDGIHEKH